ERGKNFYQRECEAKESTRGEEELRLRLLDMVLERSERNTIKVRLERSTQGMLIKEQFCHFGHCQLWVFTPLFFGFGLPNTILLLGGLTLFFPTLCPPTLMPDALAGRVS